MEATVSKHGLLAAAALIATAFLPDVAAAQRGGGGMRGGGERDYFIVDGADVVPLDT
jgi:hypothetical protein